MRVLFTSIALAGLMFAAPAAAQPSEDYSVAVPYGDLNLGSDAGLATFNGRVQASANDVCTGASDSPLQVKLQIQKCRAHFKQAAERQLQLAIGPSSGTLLAAR